MFFQVNVRKKDQSFLWFPWWPDGDMNKKAVEYCMTVHLFGTVSSPACGNYTLRHTADSMALAQLTPLEGISMRTMFLTQQALN